MWRLFTCVSVINVCNPNSNENSIPFVAILSYESVYKNTSFLNHYTLWLSPGNQSYRAEVVFFGLSDLKLCHFCCSRYNSLHCIIVSLISPLLVTLSLTSLNIVLIVPLIHVSQEKGRESVRMISCQPHPKPTRSHVCFVRDSGRKHFCHVCCGGDATLLILLCLVAAFFFRDTQEGFLLLSSINCCLVLA